MATPVSTLIDEVAYATGQTGIDSRILTRINWAIYAIASAITHPDVEQTATTSLIGGQASYDLPSDFLHMISVKHVEKNRLLIPMTPSDDARVDETVTGAPRRYFIYGRKIELRPVPTSDEAGDTLRLRYVFRPNQVTTSDTSPFSEELDEAIITGAAYRVYRDLGEPERAASLYRDWIAQLRLLSEGKVRARLTPNFGPPSGIIVPKTGI